MSSWHETLRAEIDWSTNQGWLAQCVDESGTVIREDGPFSRITTAANSARGLVWAEKLARRQAVFAFMAPIE